MTSIGQTQLTPHLRVPHSQIQPIADQKYLGEKNHKELDLYCDYTCTEHAQAFIFVVLFRE